MSSWLLENALFAGMLAVFVFIGIRITKPNPAVRHAFWLLVLLRLVIPPIPGLHIDFSKWAESPQVVENTIQTSPEPVIDEIPDGTIISEEMIVRSLEDIELEQRAFVAVLDTPPSTEETPPEPEQSTFSFWDAIRLLLVVWCLGAVVFAIRFAYGVARFSGYLSRNRKDAPSWLVAQVRSVASELGINPPRVEMVKGLASPMVWCLTRPKLLWPSELTNLSEEGLRAVLFHELAHVRRKDHWVRRLESLAGVFHWWNPVFWLTRRKLRTNAELACDAWASQKTNQRVFVEALLSVCAFNPQRRPAPAVAAVSDTRRELEERLTMILKESPSYRLRFRTKVALALLACVAIPAWSFGDGIPFKIVLEGAPPADVKPQGDKVEAKSFLFVVDKNATPATKEIQDLEAKIKELNATLEKMKAEAAKKAAPMKEVPARVGVDFGSDTLYYKVEKKGPDGKTITFYEAVQVPKAGETPLRVWIDKAEIKANPTPQAIILKGDPIKAAPVDNTIILSRTTYKLPADKATELAGILSKFKTSVLEVKIEKDSITVTTTPDIQSTVAGLVKLMAPALTADFKVVPYPSKPDSEKPKVPPTTKPDSEKPKVVPPATKPDSEKPKVPAPPAKPTGGINFELDIEKFLNMKLDEKTKEELKKQIQGLMEDKLKLTKEAEMKAVEAERAAKEALEKQRYVERLKAAEAELQKKVAEEAAEKLRLEKKKYDEELQKKLIEERKKADAEAEAKKAEEEAVRKGLEFLKKQQQAETEKKALEEKKLIEEKKKLIEEIERKIRENEKK